MSEEQTASVSKIKQLEQIGRQSYKMTIGLTALRDENVLENFKISFQFDNARAERVGHIIFNTKSLTDAMNILAKNISLERVLKVECRCLNSPIDSKELKQLTLEAWCEAFHFCVPSVEFAKKTADEYRTKKDATRDTLLSDLRHGGEVGLARWNAWSQKRVPAISHFRMSDLRGADLRGARWGKIDFQGSNFSDCVISGANLKDANLQNCNFQNADLSGAQLSGAFTGTNFTGASLRTARLHSSSLSNANLCDTDFSGADFSNVDLRGSNLSTAILENVIFGHTAFNEETQWPPGFRPNVGLQFSGSGKNPFVTEKIKANLPAGKLNFEWYISRLETEFDKARVQKALQMLKAERFQLFSQVSCVDVVGIVKSQTSDNLFYSCFLKESGAFSCTSQNLAACGGLKGSLCKHLLVLLIGMTRAGLIDTRTACEWVLASRTRKSTIDRELMTSTLLRYKAATVGEVDWRPTETMPEDYYAF